MKKTLIILVALIIGSYTNTFAQKTVDIGVFGGGSYYLGDVNTYKQFYSLEKSYGVVFRVNFDKRYSLKVTAISGRLSGSDLDFDNPFQQMRAHQFSTGITDFAALVEFNFFDFSTKDPKYIGTPYINGGIGAVIAPDISTQTTLTIPFGVGMKFRLGKYLSFGGEWTMRKTFTDALDQLDAHYFAGEGSGAFTNKQKTQLQSDDWYSFAGIFLTFTLYGKTTTCRAYYH